MNRWQEDLLSVTDGQHSEASIFTKITVAAKDLGFEFCAYGLRMPAPLSKPTIIMLNNYPVEWQRRYAEARYVEIDPTVQHGRKSQTPLVWSDEVFQSSPDLWDEAQSFGLRVGWVQSSLDANGVGGMLSLARSSQPLNADELAGIELKLRWLVNIAHMSLSRCYANSLGWQVKSALTEREVEVLKWTADGKTSSEISDILALSENTVNYHVKNAIAKLQSVNKTSAVVRAAMLGLLN